MLILADSDLRRGAVAVHDLRRNVDHLLVELGDALRRADRHVEFDVGNAEIDAAEALGVWLVQADGVAPRAGRLDVVVGLDEIELGVGELGLHHGEPLEQRFAALDDDAGLAAQHLGVAGRQMELAAADIHPHVGVVDLEIRIAGEAEARAVEERGYALVGNGDVDVLKVNGVAEVFGGAIEGLLVSMCVSWARARKDDAGL